MSFNKKKSVAIITTIWLQFFLGIEFVNAMQCEREIEQQWNNSHTYGDGGKEYYGITAYYTSEKSFEQVKKDYNENIKWLTSPDEENPTKKGWQRMNGDKYKSCKEYAVSLYNEAIAKSRPGNACVAKYMIDNNCKNIDLLNPSNISSQQNNSSSNQKSSAKTSNSPVSQNKQSYQAAQLAHNQANAGKGKKHNSNAEASECMKNNANGTHWKNVCKFTVNLSYCFIGVVPGQEAEDTQILADINCQNEQYANTELSAGEELAGNYGGLTIGAFICKSPSQPLDMTFDRSGPEVTGRCSF